MDRARIVALNRGLKGPSCQDRGCFDINGLWNLFCNDAPWLIMITDEFDAHAMNP
jgi:hypothetical protein